MKLLAPMCVFAALSAQAAARKIRGRCWFRRRNPKYGDPELLADVTIDFNNLGGRIWVYSTEAGPEAGYVQIRQIGIQEIDDNGKKVSNFNLEKEFDWADPVPLDPVVVGGETITGYTTQFGAVQFESGHNQVQIDLTLIQEETTLAIKQLSCNGYANPASNGTNFCVGANEVPSSYGACGVLADSTCQDPPFTVGRDGSITFLSCPDNVQTNCYEYETSPPNYVTRVNVQIGSWQFQEPNTHLRYVAKVKSRLGGQEARRIPRRKSRFGKWVSPVGLSEGSIDVREDGIYTGPEFDTIGGGGCGEGTGDGTDKPCQQIVQLETSVVITDKAGYIHVDIEKFPPTGAVSFLVIINMESLAEVNGASTIAAPAVAFLSALFASLF